MTTAVEPTIDPAKELLRRYKQDFPYFARERIKIQTKKGDLIAFRFNEDQTILEAIEKDILSRGRLLRMVILKARRRGVSTHRIAKNYHRTIFKFNRYAYHVTHEPDSKDFLFSMTKRMHANNPCRPKELYNSKSILEFNTKDRTGMDSAIRVGAAGKDHLGSGQLIHYLHLSELAKYPRHAEAKLLTSLLQCVPRDPDSEVAVESTAAGLGGEFYEWFWSARFFYEVYLHKGKPVFRVTIRPDADAENEYAAIFIPWFTNSEYQMDPEPGFKRTTVDHPVYGNEAEMVKLYAINDRHLKWRRVMIANECKGKPEVFRQEYPSNPEEAFLATGRPVFTPINAVLARKKALEKAQREKDPRKFYTCMFSTGQWIATTPERGDTDSILQVWEEPRQGAHYVVSADVAEGLEKGDWDSVDVLEQLTGRQVAHWHGHTAPDQLAVLLYHIGHRYNVACVAPERNNHGLTTVSKLFTDLNYPNLYVEEVDDPPHKKRKRYGWHTTSANKPLAVDGMAADFRAAAANINCVETLGEMLSFKHENDGSMGAESGRFDDRVISFAIGNHVRKTLALPSSSPAVAVPSGSPVPATPTTPSMAGFT